ncbi:MAG: helix-turn-helix domain-containing protein [Terracidiphilus sp.]|jgi:ArsR family transcriptional regulator
MTRPLLEKPSSVAPPVKSARLTRARRTTLLKALADPMRFDLLERVARNSCPLGCTEALKALPIAAATLSHHIKELESAGLIHVERQGKFHFLSLRPGVLSALAASLDLIETTAIDLPRKY